MKAESEHHIADDLERALAASRGTVPEALLARPRIDRLLADAIADWVLITVAWLAMSQLPTWTYAVTALVVASRLHSFGVVLHDAAHMPVRHKTGKLRLLEALSGYAIGTTLNAMRYHHLRHHRDSGLATDPYFKRGIESRPLLQLAYTLRGIALVPFWTLRGLIGSTAYYLPSLRNFYGRTFLQDRSGDDLCRSAEVIQCAGEDRWQLLCHATVAPVAVVWPGPFVYGYVIPSLLGGLLAAHRLLLEHAYVRASDRRRETIIRTTADHNLRGLGRFLLAPRNIGYHIVHHLHPQVAWHALPTLRQWYCVNYPQQYPAAPRSPWYAFARALRGVG